MNRIPTSELLFIPTHSDSGIKGSRSNRGREKSRRDRNSTRHLDGKLIFPELSIASLGDSCPDSRDKDAQYASRVFHTSAFRKFYGTVRQWALSLLLNIFRCSKMRMNSKHWSEFEDSQVHPTIHYVHISLQASEGDRIRVSSASFRSLQHSHHIFARMRFTLFYVAFIGNMNDFECSKKYIPNKPRLLRLRP